MRRMLSSVDHSLSSCGWAECNKLATQIKEWSESESVVSDEDTVQKYQRHLVTGKVKILCSPMKRAVQTAMLALGSHPACVADGITLTEPLREIKSRVGFDCVSDHFGAAIEESAIADLQTLEDTDEKVLAKSFPSVDSSAIGSPWWTSKTHKDQEGEVARRLSRLSAAVQHCPETTVVLVGHSNLFREYVCGDFGRGVLSRGGCLTKPMHISSLVTTQVLQGNHRARVRTKPSRSLAHSQNGKALQRGLSRHPDDI